MNLWINYHHLFYFKTIAEQGSVSKAAEKLRLGQPTLSAQLKLFEETLEVQLFERQRKKLILTEQGKVALDYARSIFRLGSEMYEVLHDRMKSSKPTLHLGALDSIPKEVILELVKSAYKISPCQITLSEGKSNELIRILVSHEMDLMVTNFIPNGIDARGLKSRTIAKNRIALYGAQKFKKLIKEFPRSLSGAPLILPTFDSRLRQDFEHWAQVQKVELNIVAESQDIAIKKMMATNGLGLIAASPSTVSVEVSRGDLIKIGELQGVTEDIFLVSAGRKIENSIASQLIATFSSRR